MHKSRAWTRAVGAGLGLILVGCADNEGGGSSDTSVDSGGAINGANAVGKEVQLPFDATPSPTADAVYFTAVAGEGASVFKVPAGGGTPMEIASGFTAPMSLVMSTDGATVYVSDLVQQAADESKPMGAIYSVPATGGAPELLSTTVGYSPRSLDLVREGDRDVIYFSGFNPVEGLPGVYRMVVGDKVVPIYEGPKLREPGGVAVSSEGDVFVVDAIGGGDLGRAALLRITGGAVEEVRTGLHVGYPAGVALTFDEAFILISGRNGNTGGAQVYRISLADPGTTEIIDMGISQNTESAGLHRAHETDNYAWANADAPGTVFFLGTELNPLP